MPGFHSQALLREPDAAVHPERRGCNVMRNRHRSLSAHGMYLPRHTKPSCTEKSPPYPISHNVLLAIAQARPQVQVKITRSLVLLLRLTGRCTLRAWSPDKCTAILRYHRARGSLSAVGCRRPFRSSPSSCNVPWHIAAAPLGAAARSVRPRASASDALQEHLACKPLAMARQARCLVTPLLALVGRCLGAVSMVLRCMSMP